MDGTNSVPTARMPERLGGLIAHFIVSPGKPGDDGKE